MTGNRRTRWAETRALRGFWGQETPVAPGALYLQLCTSEPTDTAVGSVPSSGTGLADRRQIPRSLGLWRLYPFGPSDSTAQSNTIANRYGFGLAKCLSPVVVGYFEIWDQQEAGLGNRWLIGEFVEIPDPILAPEDFIHLDISLEVGQRIYFPKGAFRIKED